MDKNFLMEKLRQQGIETRPIFSPIHLQNCYQRYHKKNLPVAESCSGLNLPSSVDITKEELIRVTETIKAIIQSQCGKMTFEEADGGSGNSESRIQEPGARSQDEQELTGILE